MLVKKLSSFRVTNKIGKIIPILNGHKTVSYTNIKLPLFPNILRSILNSFYLKYFKINFGSEAFLANWDTRLCLHDAVWRSCQGEAGCLQQARGCGSEMEMLLSRPPKLIAPRMHQEDLANPGAWLDRGAGKAFQAFWSDNCTLLEAEVSLRSVETELQKL